jgi:hypothetical protein
MTERAGTIAVEPDFRRNQGKSGRLTLGTHHRYTSEAPISTEPPKESLEGVIKSNVIIVTFSTGCEIISNLK